MTTTTTPTDQENGIRRIIPERNPLQVFLSLEPLKAFIFMMLSFAIGLFTFVTLVSLLSTGLAMTFSVFMAIVGIPLLGVTALIWMVLGHGERIRMHALAGVHIPSPYRPLPEGSFSERAKAFFKDGALWRDLLYLALLFPIGLAQFVFAVVGVSVPLSMIATPIIVELGGSVQITGYWTITDPAHAFPIAIFGGILLVIAAYSFVIILRAHAVFARWLIGPNDREQLVKRVETLSETRSRMVGVSLEDRRNIERDIHDSAQPKLVSLAMNLGLAKEKLESDPEQAKQLVEAAHREARDVLAEIRNIVRGLHPSILTDRGLEAAIRSLAGYCPVPVTVDVELDERPPEAVETTAYYIIAEALTNVGKHSQASEAHVIVRRDGDILSIEVVDDGNGGALPAPGSGLSGLIDRAAALDGTLEIDSPEGGPTRIRARLPCVS
jgi:signal transduction histidine kinase